MLRKIAIYTPFNNNPRTNSQIIMNKNEINAHVNLKYKNQILASLQEFTVKVLQNEPLCGSNKIDFFDPIHQKFGFYHYHCGPIYNEDISVFHNNKICFSGYDSPNKKKPCDDCIILKHRIGKNCAEVIYYLKLDTSKFPTLTKGVEYISVVGYGLKDLPFTQVLSSKYIQDAVSQSFNNFIISE